MANIIGSIWCKIKALLHTPCVCMYVLCMYVCTSVCMYVCMYVCVYVCMYVYTNVCMYVYTYVFACVRVYVCTYVCIYECVHVCIYTYVFACVRVYVCMYVYIRMYVCMYDFPHFPLPNGVYNGHGLCSLWGTNNVYTQFSWTSVFKVLRNMAVFMVKSYPCVCPLRILKKVTVSYDTGYEYHALEIAPSPSLFTLLFYKINYPKKRCMFFSDPITAQNFRALHWVALMLLN
jgi:hypothetical protein